MPSKNYTLFFILSVGFVLLSISFITILGQTSSKEGPNKDIRAKATVQNSLSLTGIVSSIDTGSRTFVVDQVKFVNNDEAPAMGTFTATVATGVDMKTIKVGTTIRLSVDAASFNTQGKTFTVLAVNR